MRHEPVSPAPMMYMNGAMHSVPAPGVLERPRMGLVLPRAVQVPGAVIPLDLVTLVSTVNWMRTRSRMP